MAMAAEQKGSAAHAGSERAAREAAREAAQKGSVAHGGSETVAREAGHSGSAVHSDWEVHSGLAMAAEANRGWEVARKGAG